MEVNAMKGIPYASACGSLMYAMVATRPDIACAKKSTLGGCQMCFQVS